MRVMLASNRQDPDAVIGALMARLTTMWPDAEVHPALQAYSELFTGSWDDYAREVGRGLRLDGEPRYDVLVVPNRRVGRVTADILRHALAVAKPVLYIGYDPAEPPAAVVDVTDASRHSWKDGWQVEVA